MAAWRLIKTPKLSGLTNMQTDLKMFHDFEAGLISSTLRIYSWKPKCISYGYAQKVDRLIALRQSSGQGGSEAQKRDWDIVKRPTGGGIVFHNEAEVTYSLITELDNPKLPKGLVPSYKKLSEAIVHALNLFNINSELKPTQEPANPPTRNSLCFSYPAEYEVVVDGRKIVGSAQKRGKRTLLQQGSIFVRNTSEDDFSLLKQPNQAYNAVSVEEVLGRTVGFEELYEALVVGFCETLKIELKTQKL
ncbi:MAG: lipoate--protein ligase family protein [Candidatus Margulisbacteria bacterium]|nr:lipoate--protein ligase family protein [Candidatus Margulisiibacteriota bacterium]